MASPSPSSPVAAASPTAHPNGSSISISGALSSTPTESPLLDPDFPSLSLDPDDAALAAAASKGRRRSSLQAPGLIQYQPAASIPPTQPTIPGSPTAEAHSELQMAPTTSSGGAAGARPNQVGEGQPLLVEFLLVSGKRTRWTVGDQATVREVREAVWRGWPEEWRGQEENPPSAESLRLLYLGKFLDDKRTLGFYGLTPPASAPPPAAAPSSSAPPAPAPAPAPTIIHLNIRPLATEGEYQDDLLKPQKSSNMCGGCCLVC